ncbi:peroxisomal ATPase PEX6-like [Tubulanus polymorphus]|uniref:peroxisomal ATPase PEX6-like n=1 Tax=Tubulanus polymorphus TaxID=672921 RepID=UPI003DA3C9BD
MEIETIEDATLSKNELECGFPLEKVVIGVKNHQVFLKLKKPAFAASLLSSFYNNKIVVRNNEQPKIRHLEDQSVLRDLSILECLPVCEGYITAKTSIVYVNVSNIGNLERCSDKVGNHFEISDNEDAFIPVRLNYNSINLSKTLDYNDFTCVRLSAELLERFNLTDGGNAKVVIPLTTHVKSDNSHCIGGEQRVVQVKKYLNDEFGNSMSIPYNLWFNLKYQAPYFTRKEKRIKLMTPNDGNDLSPEQNVSCALPLSVLLPQAQEIHVKSINSPMIDASQNYDEQLIKFFSTTRILMENDVIAVDISDKVEKIHIYGKYDEFKALPQIAFFKVIKLLPSNSLSNTYRAHSDYSTLYQTGNLNSYIPSIMNEYLCENSDLELHLHPPGLARHTENLVGIIEPHVKPNASCGLVASILITGPMACGKTTICQAAAHQFGMHFIKVNCHELCGDSSASTEVRIKQTINRALSYTPCILLLRNIHVLGKDRDGSGQDDRVAHSLQTFMQTMEPETYPLVIVATTAQPKQLHSDIIDAFSHEIKIESPDEDSRAKMIAGVLAKDCISCDVNFDYIGQRTAGMVAGDIQALVVAAKRHAVTRLRNYCSSDDRVPSYDEEKKICKAGICLVLEDFQNALNEMQAAHSKSIGAPKIPNVTWDDVGGLASVKAEILDTIQLPLRHPEMFASGMRRSGVLLYGPPGTGKTLLAKAVATECSLNFLSVKGPELINMYVGQSEENVREVFHKARSAIPCVIFFDELDSLAPNRGKSGDSGGVMDRVVSQMLAELDGLHKACDVFVIGATNRPDLLDPALLRPGRFDKMLYVGISDDVNAKINILQALTRKFELAETCRLNSIAMKCPANMTGADFYALCSDATLHAITKKIELLENGTHVDQSSLVIEEDDFMEALKNLQPSVSLEELERYSEIRNQLQTSKS